MAKIALVTGANKGIGFAVAEALARDNWQVLLGARDRNRGLKATEQLLAEGHAVEYVELDVTDQSTVSAAASEVRSLVGHIDVLVNNAGGILPGDGNILTLAPDVLFSSIQLNAVGALIMTQAFWPLLLESQDARVINVSSQGGSLTNMGAWAPAYCIAKTALNAVTVQFAVAGRDRGISVNAVCPGWVRTDTGGPSAPRTPEQGAAIVVKLATQSNPPTGGYWNDAGAIPW